MITTLSRTAIAVAGEGMGLVTLFASPVSVWLPFIAGLQHDSICCPLMNDLIGYIEKKRSEFRAKLRPWSEIHHRNFPWRDPGRTAYETLIAEVMLKRTTAESASRIYLGFLEKYPTLQILEKATAEELALDFRSLGLHFQRADALEKLAKYLIAQEGGSVPNKFDRLIKVPGLGDYSTRAILSFGYGRKAAVVDANVVRVISRVFRRMMPDHPGIQLTQIAADALVPSEGHRWFNYAMLDLGRLVCRSSNPNCSDCPLFSICDYAESRDEIQPIEGSLAKRLLKFRREKGFSLSHLAHRATVSKMTVINLEAGRTVPRATTVEKLAEALEVPVELLRGDEV